jgi:hypothetical protein
VTLAASAAPNEFARAHDTYVQVNVETAPGGATSAVAWRNTTQALLDRLLARGALSRRQWAAGERLRGDLHAAALAPRVTTRLDAPLGVARADPAWGLAPSERAAASRARVRRALDAVGRRLADVLLAVVWHEVAASAWARDQGLDASNARPAGMMALRLALDTLADHYGLPEAG